MHLGTNLNEPKASALSAAYMQNNKITVNQPTQTHFTVEGVQLYTPQEIKAMKAKEQRVNPNAQKQGEYIGPKVYQLDQVIQYVGRAEPPTNPAQEKIRKTLRAGSAKPKEEKQPVKPTAKTSVKKEMKQANQKIVKLDKQKQKKDAYQRRLDALTKQYKEHFGDSLKSLKKNNYMAEAETVSKHEQEEEFGLEEDAGDEMMPGQKPAMSLKSPDKQTKAVSNSKNDDSFEEVEWEGMPVSVGKKNASTYSERLGDAVYKLFD